MTPDEYIQGAIERGERWGLASLDETQAAVFLISEAEVLCDMEGVDSFLDTYDAADIRRCAGAFTRVGANEIAVCLRSIAARLPERDEALLTRANALLTGRAGYDAEAVRRMVADRVE